MRDASGNPGAGLDSDNPGSRATSEPGWPARLYLDVVDRADATRLARASGNGPLYIQRALYPEGPRPAHLYLLHPPGGAVQGDTIDIELNVARDAHALVTTPAAGKIYRTPQSATRQQFMLRAAGNADLEWLPQEAIVFDGAYLTSGLCLDITATSRVLAWDIVALGRPVGDAPFDHGLVANRLQVSVDGLPVLVESGRVPGASDAELFDANWGLGARPAFGTLVAYAGACYNNPTLEALHELGTDDDGFGVTEVDGVLVVRHVAADAAAVRERLTHAWQILRPAILDRAPVWPRIWST